MMAFWGCEQIVLTFGAQILTFRALKITFHAPFLALFLWIRYNHTRVQRKSCERK